MLRSFKRWWLWKKADCGLALVALKRTGCDVWQMECHPERQSARMSKRQATLQQMFKVTTFCTDTCFQFFLPLINCIIHHALLKFSPCRNKTLTQIVHIADWYSIYAPLQHGPDAVIYWVEVRTVGWPHVSTDELRCLRSFWEDVNNLKYIWMTLLKWLLLNFPR